MNTIKIECESCKGTGIYKGMAERGNYGVVCSNCNGTGCVEFKYKEFKEKKIRPDVAIVVERNPGICLDGEIGISLKFGGMPYLEWLHNPVFPKGSEMRNFICPAWWYRNDIKRCKGHTRLGGRYSHCNLFHSSKSECWKEFDERSKNENN